MGTKKKSPKQGLTSAKDLTIELLRDNLALIWPYNNTLASGPVSKDPGKDQGKDQGKTHGTRGTPLLPQCRGGRETGS